MMLEPGDLLVTDIDLETRLVIATQPYVGVPKTKEIEVLLLYTNGTMRWYSSAWLAKTMRKVGDDTEELE